MSNPMLQALPADALADCDHMAFDLPARQAVQSRAGRQRLFEEGLDG